MKSIREKDNTPETSSSGRNRLSKQLKIRRRKRIRKSSPVKGAENRLKKFKQASFLAVAFTGFLLLMFSPADVGYSQSAEKDSTEQTDQSDTIAEDIAEADSAEEVILTSEEATDEAIGALHNMWRNFVSNLPKILIALSTLFLAWILTKILKYILRRILQKWSTSDAITTLVLIAVWLFAIGVAFSVVAGDIRAIIGSFGLIGLALSWSLQTPIESFTGWLLNSFQRYYKVGDRIRVGDVFGDVYSIDFLTTTVWEIGSPHQAGFVNAEQPTGRLVTFPNNEILSGSVVNLTGDFPYVWDELAIAIANESQMRLAMQVVENVANNLLGDYMVVPAQAYRKILKRARLTDEVAEKPQIFVVLNSSWTDLIIRYLVGARERRKWKTELYLQVMEELSKPEYKDKIISVYPRQQLQFINSNGMPADYQVDV
jgi:small-conductance mechanosensitive channel